MKNKTIILGAFAFILAASTQVSAQTTITPAKKEVQQREELTPLKPIDGKPYVFSSQADLDAAKQKKSDAIREDIKNNLDNPMRVKTLREDLWRLENATVRAKQ